MMQTAAATTTATTTNPFWAILTDPARRAVVRQFVADRLNAIRGQLPQDAAVTIGPNASSMGWIFQYALVDRQGVHDLRELRLLNESLVGI